MSKSPSFFSEILSKTTDFLRWSVGGIVTTTTNAIKDLFTTTPIIPVPGK